jgi:uracil-DNA glycosylase family 4
MKVKDCSKCRLSESRTKIVNGKGNPKAKYLFVGEAPGREEDEGGLPFVGAAGRTLFSQIKAAGLNIKDVAWTNVCRCRPPNNRTPDSDEIDSCKAHLFQEIEEMQPDFIIALGDIAAMTLTGKKTMPFRGSVLEVPTLPCPVLITAHPARSFHERAYYDIIIWDLYKLFWDKDRITNSTKGYLINPSYGEVLKWLDKACYSGLVAVDIETVGKNEEDEDRGLNPRRDVIEGIGFCCEKGDALHVSGTRMKECWGLIKKFLENHPGLVYQNNRFDRAFLKVAGINSLLHWDTLTGMYLFNPDLTQGFRRLEFQRSVHTNIMPYKHAYWSGTGNINLGVYNCLDTDVTLQIALAQKTFVRPDLMERLCGESDVALDMMLKGVKIDKNKLAAHWLDFKPKMQELEQEFLSEYGVEIASNKQISNLLYNTLGLSYERKSQKKTLISVDDAALEYAKKSLYMGKEAFPKEYSCLEKIQEYRDCQKTVNTYCEGMFKLIQEDGRIHPWWKPEGTDTGRWACRNPNLQNIPTDMKDIIVPEEGRVFLYADFDRLEVWISAILSGDKDLLEVLESGVDVHGVLQKEIAQFYPSITRVQSKTTLFGTFYGRGTKDIAQQFGVPNEVAKGWQDMIFGKFKRLGKFFKEDIPKEFEEKGYITSFYGRVKYAEKITQAMNFPIQSAASDTLNNALIALHRAGFNPILNQHDAVVCEEDDTSRWEEFIAIIQTSSPLMRDVMNASGGMGYNWMELTNDKMHEAIEKDIEEGYDKAHILDCYSISELAFDTLFKKEE